VPFGEALARFIRTDPKQAAEAIAGEVLQERDEAKRRIEEARKELNDGARPRKGRFRL
jgi:hypothetical protein